MIHLNIKLSILWLSAWMSLLKLASPLLLIAPELGLQTYLYILEVGQVKLERIGRLMRERDAVQA